MGLLDETFYPFDDPDGRELLDNLARLYEPRGAKSLALGVAGLPAQRIDFRGSADDVWQSMLSVAAKSGKLRDLALVIIDDPYSVAVRPLLQRLMEDVPKPLSAAHDQFSFAMLPSRRAFIDRIELRDSLRELSDPYGARVLVVSGPAGFGKSYSWHLISHVGKRMKAYRPYRFNLADWSGSKQWSAIQVMNEIIERLNWQPVDVDVAAQPDTVVWHLVNAFKRQANEMPVPICLVFDGYTSHTADEWARRLIVRIAAAANDEEAGDARVVLLEVEAQLPEELARDAMSEKLRSGQLDDLPKFFTAAAAAVGEEADDEAMRVLVETVLGPPPHPAEFPLHDIGPRAAKVASAAFRRARRNGPAVVSADEVRRRLGNIVDSLVAPPLVMVGEPRWRLRAAAVLRAFFKAGDLAAHARGARGGISDDDLQSFIQLDCEPVNSMRGTGWQLLPTVRRETVRHLGGDIDRLLETTRGVAADDADLGRTMAELYLRGEAPAIEEQTPDQLTGSLLAVDWFSGVNLGLPTQSRLRRQLQLSDLLQPLRFVADGPFVGRTAELDQVAEYVDRSNGPVWRPLVIYGPGGMGKSAVVARFLLDRSASSQASRLSFTYLTFDRAELLPQRPLGLLAEMIRQLSLQYPEIALDSGATIAALEQTQLSIVGSQQERSVARATNVGVSQRRVRDEQELVHLFAKVVNALDPRSVICVLDTFERAQRHGLAAVDRLWEILNSARSLVPGLKIVIAGRASVIGHPVEELPLTGLDPRCAVQYLRARVGDAKVNESLLEAAAKRVGGNPLSLRLVADLMCREIGTLHTAAGRRKFLLSLESDVIQGVLYRRVLDHIDDTDVRALAIPGLALRRITPEVIEEVLGPSSDLGAISPARARRLFRKLRQDTSLVMDAGDVLIHRADVRQEVLPLLQSEDPAGVASIHRRAISFYSKRNTVADRTEELYHRLALGQSTKTLDRRWDDEAGARLDAAFNELPKAGQVYLASRLGFQADPAALVAADDEAWARQAIRSARSYLDGGNPQSALAVLRQRTLSITVFDHAALEVETLARLGHRSAAQKLVKRGRNAATESGKPAEFIRFSLLGAQIAEDGGRYSQALTLLSEAREVAQTSDDLVNTLVAGVGMLRVLRRSNRGNTKRALDLRANVIVEASNLSRRQRTANPSLVRDIAAEIGTDLPQFVIEAPKLVGIDVTSPEARETLIAEGREESAAKAAEILKASRRERGVYDESDLDYEPVTSDQQGAIVSDYLQRAEDKEGFEAVSDLFKSEADQPSFDPDLRMLQDTIVTFDRFVAIEKPTRSFVSADANTEILLNLPEVDRQLEKLTRISVTTWPDVHWANDIARAVVRTQEKSRRFSRYASNQERDELLNSVHELRNLITRRYPRLLKLSGTEEVECRPEFFMEVRECCDIGTPWPF